MSWTLDAVNVLSSSVRVSSRATHGRNWKMEHVVVKTFSSLLLAQDAKCVRGTVFEFLQVNRVELFVEDADL